MRISLVWSRPNALHKRLPVDRSGSVLRVLDRSGSILRWLLTGLFIYPLQHQRGRVVGHPRSTFLGAARSGFLAARRTAALPSLRGLLRSPLRLGRVLLLSCLVEAHSLVPSLVDSGPFFWPAGGPRGPLLSLSKAGEILAEASFSTSFSTTCQSSSTSRNSTTSWKQKCNPRIFDASLRIFSHMS